MKEKIKTLTDKKVELVSTVDKDIIGGFILRLGDQQFDASVANQLQSSCATLAMPQSLKTSILLFRRSGRIFGEL